MHFLKSKWSDSFISVKYYMCTCTVKQLHLPLSSDSSCWKRPCSPFPSLPLLLFPHFHLLTYTPFHFVYSDIGSFHTTSEEYENAAALFLRLGQPSTLIRHENKAFRKRSSYGTLVKTPSFCFRVDGKYFENGAFENDGVTIIT